MTPVRVLIADDHKLFRQCLRRICETLGGFEVAGEAETGSEAVALCRELKPDVVLMDINMPGLSGVQATRAVTEENPNVAVVMLTMYRQEHHVFEAIKAGACGYVVKTCEEDELIDAIAAAHRGEASITPGLAAKVIAEFRRLSEHVSDGDATDGLTPGEMDVLRLVAHGEDNEAIAHALCISKNTVSNRLRAIYQKLHVHNRTQAALEALRRGWASLEDEDRDRS